MHSEAYEIDSQEDIWRKKIYSSNNSEGIKEKKEKNIYKIENHDNGSWGGGGNF